MARIIFDSFAFYPTGGFPTSSKWDGKVGGGGIAGPTGGTSPRWSGTNGKWFSFDNGTYLYKTVTNIPSVIIGLAYRQTGGTSWTASSPACIGAVMDGATMQFSWWIEVDGSISLRRGTHAGPVLVQGPPQAWSALFPVAIYFEAEVDIHPSAGTATITQNGVVLATASGLNTAPSGTGQGTEVRVGGADNSVGGIGFGGGEIITDVYVYDKTGARNNARLGDARIHILYPNAAGSVTGLTPHGVANNWDCVNDTEKDDDGTYVDGTSSASDLYGCTDLPAGFSGAIESVAHSSWVKKDDAGALTFKQHMKSGATDLASAAKGLTTAYAYNVEYHDDDPDTSAGWVSAAAVNGLEIGPEVV
jgi:hypothetical protein